MNTHEQPPKLTDFADASEWRELVSRARAEDLGPRGDDITSRLAVPEQQHCTAEMRTRADGVMCGLALMPEIIRAYDLGVELTTDHTDGDAITRGDAVLTLRGPLRSVLMLERVALNFCCHLSGVATLTRQFADAVAHTRAGIYDTRKTIPGLRRLAKYAVACGGGHNHRIGLYDAVLVKDNHIAHTDPAELQATMAALVERARAQIPPPSFIEIEVDTLDQLQRVLPTGVDVVLLDNMPPAELREAVALRDAAAPGVALEASGGVTIETVAGIAETGVDRIAVGAITHSAAQLDLGLDIAPR